jgi:tRNA-binding EMAP/Myf-like protein
MNFFLGYEIVPKGKYRSVPSHGMVASLDEGKAFSELCLKVWIF